MKNLEIGFSETIFLSSAMRFCLSTWRFSEERNTSMR